MKKIIKKLKRFIRECKYTLNQLKKPNPKEYWFTVKITSTIITITGLIGYVFYLMFYFLEK
ncbi:MAG: protein translocase SEC61 complex subunit gamma [Nanoarchaeota archaeon]